MILPGAWRCRGCGASERPHRVGGRAGRRMSRGRATLVPIVDPRLGRTGLRPGGYTGPCSGPPRRFGRGTHGWARNPGLATVTGVPVTMAARGSGRRARSHGGASLAPRRSRAAGPWSQLRSAGPAVADSRHASRRQEAAHTAMLRLLHTADVHLGARHADLGEQAAAQRERQFAAFRATVDLALAEKVDLVPHRRRPVRLEHPAAPLRGAGGRGARAARRGAHPDRASSRAPTTSTTARRSTGPTTSPRWPAAGRTTDLVTILTPEQPDGPPRGARRDRLRPRLRDEAGARTARWRASTRTTDHRATWQIGHGPRLDRDPRQDRPRRGRHHDRRDRGERARLPRPRPLALVAARARRAASTYAYSGAPEPVALDQDRAGKVLLVDARRSRREARVAGSRSARSAGRGSRRSTSTPPRSRASRRSSRAPGRARRPGPRPRRPAHRRPARRARPRRRRGRDRAGRLVPQGARPRRVRAGTDRGPAAVRQDTIAGAFIRDLEARIAELEASGAVAEAAELRDALRLGRLLLAGHEVTL